MGTENWAAKDFTYSGFSVSRHNIRAYLKNMKQCRRASIWGGSGYFSSGETILQSMISSIADNNYSFDTHDTEMCELVEEMIKKAGRNANGVYSDNAHQAMRNICIAMGKNPDEHVLFDKTVKGRMDKASSKIKKLFGFGKVKETKQAHEPEPDFESLQEYVMEPTDSLREYNLEPEAYRATDNAAASMKEKNSDAPQNTETKTSKKSFKKKFMYTITATVAGLAAIGAGLLMSSDTSKNVHDASHDKAPTFKTVTMPDAKHTVTQAYNLTDGVKKPHVATQAKNKTATDSVSAQLTRTSKSSLDILLGEKEANDLCRRVQQKIDAGIFAAPRGMSAERIAHAITMSRIYEGNSVVLDAMNAQTKLTPAQQAAFEQHIDEIGDMGVKLQKRMAKKQKLSKHSRFNKAPKTLRQMHIKNLQQLQQMRKMAHVR